MKAAVALSNNKNNNSNDGFMDEWLNERWKSPRARFRSRCTNEDMSCKCSVQLVDIWKYER